MMRYTIKFPVGSISEKNFSKITGLSFLTQGINYLLCDQVIGVILAQYYKKRHPFAIVRIFFTKSPVHRGHFDLDATA